MRTYAAGTLFAVLLGLAGLRRRRTHQPPVFREDQGQEWVGTKAACVIRNSGTVPVTVNVSMLTNIE